MANLEPLIQSIPVAPLKLASLEGCRTLADQVNNYLVSFRHESPTNVGQADSLQGYCADSYLLERRRKRRSERICTWLRPFYYGRCYKLQPDLSCKWL